jgi:hypothetical protein
MPNTSRATSGLDRPTDRKVPPNFQQDYEPGFDPELDQTLRGRPNYTAVETSRSSSSWPAVWILMILAVAGIVAYGFFGNQTVVSPTTTQSTTDVTPPSATVQPPAANTTNEAAPAEPPATTVTPPAVEPPATNAAPAAPATNAAP